MDYSFDNLPPLRPERTSLLAIPQPIAMPCYRVPEYRRGVILRHNQLAGTFELHPGDWHIMPDIAMHFTVPGRTIWDSESHPYPAYPSGKSWFEVIDDGDKSIPRAYGAFEQLCIYWAGAEHYIERHLWVVRHRPGRVIGQVPAGFPGGRFFQDEKTWVRLEEGDFLVVDYKNGPVRAIPPQLMPFEFSRLVRRETPNPHASRQHPDEIVLDFTAGYSPFIAAE